MALSPGQHFGPYQIVGLLGAGGMGQVYRAHDPRLGRDVALKVLPPGVATDPDRLARFRREARALAAANHPHIVTIYSIEEEHGDLFLTMELVEGRPLDRAVAETGLPLARCFEIGLALADALSAAHRKGIVHRDLKPANVIVGEDGLVKVLDFGLARETAVHESAEDATSTSLTQAGMIVGTAPYMSPEQIEAKPLDHRSDIFSLGVVLYEMAAGTRPFTGDSGLAVMSSILKDRPRPLSELREDVPQGLSSLTSRCLEKSPANRVQTAQEVHAELKALQRAWESGALLAGPPASRPSDLRVAVLPFTFRGGTDAEALAEGLTDDITAGLSRFSYLRVVSRHEADVARGHSADALAAERVGARYLIEGAVRTAGTTLRLTVRLVDTSTHAHIWAQTYDRALGGDSFALQDDLTARVVATVGDTNGVLARTLAMTLRDRDAGELSADELVMRFFGYAHHFRPDERRVLRDAFPRALAREPGHALAWACQAILYEHEYTQRLDPAPEARSLCAEAAQRAIELDPTCQTAWRVLAGLRFFARDLNGLRVAVEHSVSLNPLHTTHLAYVGQLRAYAGDWDRGIEIVLRAMDLNPHLAGWVHYALTTNEYRKGNYERALIHAKRSNLPQFVWTALCVAVSAGQLGLAADARDAIDEIRRNHPALLDPAKVRALWSVWQWDGELVDRLLVGFEKALALAR